MKITLAKAIEILDFNIKEANPKMPPDVEASVKMGINAQKAIQDHRRGVLVDFNLPLPDEILTE